MIEHEDQIDRELLTNVPVVAENQQDREKMYRHFQWLHMLRTYGEIMEMDKPLTPNDVGLSLRGRPRRDIY